MTQTITTKTFRPIRDKQPLRVSLATCAITQRLRKDEVVSVTTFVLAHTARRYEGGTR